MAQEARDLQSALEQSFDDEVKKALDSSQLEASISEQRALTESLPSAVSALVEAGYPADKCLEAYAAVSSLLGTSISLEDTLRYMTNFLLDGDIFGDSA